MITKISGRLIALDDESATLGIEAFEYQVFVPQFVQRHLQPQIGQPVTLETIYYLDGDPSRGRVTPRLVGFQSKIERDFFELFCSVDGLGAKKALRAMVRPVKDIAEMIEEQNTDGLSSLPGIGAATAERIVAKLRRKMSKFALLVVRDEPHAADVKRDVIVESYEALRALGHSEVDARKHLDAVLKTKKKYASVEDVLHAVYQQSHEKEGK